MSTGNSTYLRDEQPLNAPYPTPPKNTDFGSDTPIRDVQSMNALSAISSTDSGISTDFSSLHPDNASYPIFVTSVPI